MTSPTPAGPVEVVQPPATVIVVQQPSRTAAVGQAGTRGPRGSTGPTGPTGPKGDKGDPGTPGNAASRFVYEQTTPAATWVIPHNLGFVPSVVTIYDSAHSEVEGDVLAVTATSLTIQFSGGFSGTAIVA